MIPIEDFKEIYENFRRTRNVLNHLSGDLGIKPYVPTPLVKELTKSLEMLCKYAPDEYFYEFAIEKYADSFSEFRTEIFLMKDFGLSDERAEKIVKKIKELFFTVEEE